MICGEKHICHIPRCMQALYQYRQLLNGFSASTDYLERTLGMSGFIYRIIENIHQRTFEDFTLFCRKRLASFLGIIL